MIDHQEAKVRQGSGDVVITGASAGVGRATGRASAERGFDMALLARGQAGLEGAVKEVEAAGVRSLAIPTDVAEFDRSPGRPPGWKTNWAPSTYGSTTP
jgi:short-subunit dehydrogenase